LQALPSPQGVPFPTAACWQVPLVQVSVVQALPSLHCDALVQLLQPAMGVRLQPLAGSQVSVVQGSVSPQVRAVPGRQLPL
jgi:hypothetical protein